MNFGSGKHKRVFFQGEFTGDERQLEERIFHVLEDSGFLGLTEFKGDLGQLFMWLRSQALLSFWSAGTVALTSEPCQWTFPGDLCTLEEWSDGATEWNLMVLQKAGSQVTLIAGLRRFGIC